MAPGRAWRPSSRQGRDAATIRFPRRSRRRSVITVKLAEFASLPDVGTRAARMNLIADEPGTKRLFVNAMTGTLYAVSYDGKSVTPYLDINDPKMGNAGAGEQHGAGLPELCLPSAVRASAARRVTASSIRGSIRRTPCRCRTSRRAKRTHARRDPAGVDGEGSEGRGVRRRRAARTVPRRASLPESQWRADRVQSAGAAGHSGVRPALHRVRRRRQSAAIR